LRLIKGSIDEVYTQDANGLLLEKVGWIQQVDMQQDAIGLSLRLPLKA
jgi:hypothetical protein